MKNPLMWLGALALALLPPPAVAQSTGSSVQFPYGYAPSTSVCVKQTDGTCTPVSTTNPFPVTGGTGGGGGGGDPSSTGTPSSAAPNTVSVLGAYDSNLVRRVLSDTGGRLIVNVNSLPSLPAGGNTIGSIANSSFNAGALVVTGDQSYTLGSTQLLNLTPSGRVKVGISSSGNIDPATQQTTNTEALLVACKNRASAAFSAGYTGALGCDAAGNLNTVQSNAPARDTNGDLRVPTVTVTAFFVSLTANTSTEILVPSTTRIGYDIQCTGTAAVGLSRVHATLTSATPSAGGVDVVIPAQSTPPYFQPAYVSGLGLTAYTGTAQSCWGNSYARQ